MTQVFDEQRKIWAAKGYSNLDVAKILCAVLVVFIHTSPLQNAEPLVRFYMENVLARIAVPLFFAISGFLFFRKLSFENGKIKRCTENNQRLISYVKKLVCLYMLWSLLYLVLVKIPLWYRTGWWGMHVIKDAFTSFFFVGTHYHLWYLLALIYAVPTLYLLLQLISIKKMLGVSVLLWICDCLVYSYSWIGVEEIPVVNYIGTRMPIVFDTFFRAVPLLMMGVYVTDYRNCVWIKHRFSIYVAAFVLCAIEASILYFLSPNKSKFSYLIFTPFLAYSGIQWLVYSRQCGWSGKICRMFRSISETVYCLHPLVIDLLCNYFDISGLRLWGMVTVVSIILAWGFMTLAQKINTRRK